MVAGSGCHRIKTATVIILRPIALMGGVRLVVNEQIPFGSSFRWRMTGGFMEIRIINGSGGKASNVIKIGTSGGEDML